MRTKITTELRRTVNWIGIRKSSSAAVSYQQFIFGRGPTSRREKKRSGFVGDISEDTYTNRERWRYIHTCRIRIHQSRARERKVVLGKHRTLRCNFYSTLKYSIRVFCVNPICAIIFQCLKKIRRMRKREFSAGTVFGMQVQIINIPIINLPTTVKSILDCQFCTYALCGGLCGVIIYTT